MNDRIIVPNQQNSQNDNTQLESIVNNDTLARRATHLAEYRQSIDQLRLMLATAPSVLQDLDTAVETFMAQTDISAESFDTQMAHYLAGNPLVEMYLIEERPQESILDNLRLALAVNE